ncbi:MAG: hypothetical protein IPH62_10900 [Ignavibacteriae bacterium]|nr:hypothetical protein [Ignavibacteriota bacterium]
MLNKRKIIYILIAIVALLLLINVVLGFIHISLPNNNPQFLSKQIIDEKFQKVLTDYGIHENWITKGKIQKGKSDSLKNSLIIQLPEDIPIAQILKDISIEFAKQPVIVSSSEEKINGSTNLIIESGNTIKLIADFKHEENLVREVSTIAFLLIQVEDLDDNEIVELMKNPIHFGVILPLEFNSTITAEKLKEGNKEYFIQLDDDSDEIDFELTDDLKLDELKSNSRKIIASFNSPRIFFIDENNSGLTKSIINFIYEKFKDRNRRVLFSNNLTLLKGENANDINSLLKFHVTNLKPGEAKTFRINVEDWFLIQDELTNIQKKGNKIVNPSWLL